MPRLSHDRIGIAALSSRDVSIRLSGSTSTCRLESFYTPCVFRHMYVDGACAKFDRISSIPCSRSPRLKNFITRVE